MASMQGMPIWFELMTPEPDAAERFYGSVVGWHFMSPPGGLGRDYRVFAAGEAAVGGLMRPPGGGTMPPGWFVYVAVDDVDATARRVEALGGAVHVPGTDIPGVGRFALVADPEGTTFYVMRDTSGRESRAFLQGDQARPGHAVWNELSTRDPEAALRFYGELFGWRQEGAMPMGELGDYRFLFAGPVSIGAVMGEVPNGRLGWQVYIMVDDIDAAADRLAAGGGRSVQGPDQIPGGSYSLVAEDPHGARFGLVGPRKD